MKFFRIDQIFVSIDRKNFVKMKKFRTTIFWTIEIKNDCCYYHAWCKFIWHYLFLYECIRIWWKINYYTEKIRKKKTKQFKKISILYDSIIFTLSQRKYVIYKKKFCAIIKLIIKYDYLTKYLYHAMIIHIDHKSLIHFLISDNDIHENIYEHWID